MVIERETGYEIVAGERRWRAAQEAKLKKVPCIIRDLTPEQNMLVALIENMQREDLNPIEEASAIDKMIRSFGLTQEEVSKSVGKSRPYITNALRLLKLPSAIQDMVCLLYTSFPIMIVLMARSFPSGLALYWFVGTLFMIGQTLVLQKMRKKKEKAKKKAAAARA